MLRLDTITYAVSFPHEDFMCPLHTENKIFGSEKWMRGQRKKSINVLLLAYVRL